MRKGLKATGKGRKPDLQHFPCVSFHLTFPQSSLQPAAILDSRPTARISTGRIKARNAAAFHKTYYGRTREPYWIWAIDRTLQQGGGMGCIRTALSNDNQQNKLSDLVSVFSEFQYESTLVHFGPRNKETANSLRHIRDTFSFSSSVISHHFILRWAEWKWISSLSRSSSSASHALPTVSSSILGAEMQSKAGGMWKCGCNLKNPGMRPKTQARSIRRCTSSIPSVLSSWRGWKTGLHPQRKLGCRVHLRSKIALPGVSRGSLGLAFCGFFWVFFQ